jgi:hypothetical protein
MGIEPGCFKGHKLLFSLRDFTMQNIALEIGRGVEPLAAAAITR